MGRPTTKVGQDTRGLEVMAAGRAREGRWTREVAPGVRLHLLRTARFKTTLCRVVLHRDLGPEATATSLLAQILPAATARHPTREALAHALADLYGAALGFSVSRLGDRQVLVGSLEWPTEHVPRARRLLGRGLGLLGDVWARPLRADRRRGSRSGPLDRDVVEMERLNLRRTLRALKDDKDRYALQRAVEISFAREPYGRDPLGREADLDGPGADDLASLHARLIGTAPVDVFLVGNLDLRTAVEAVRAHLLWPRGTGRVARVPPAAAAARARKRPQRVAERDAVAQGKLVFVYRSALAPSSPLFPAAATLTGVLGGGSYGRLFQVLREQHGLCYHAQADWNAAKGALLVTTGIKPAAETKVRRLVGSLVAEVSQGRLNERSWHAFREAAAETTAALADDRAGLLGWHQLCLTLGLDPSLRRHLAALESVKPAAVRRVGRQLALDTTFVLGPRETKSRGGRR